MARIRHSAALHGGSRGQRIIGRLAHRARGSVVLRHDWAIRGRERRAIHAALARVARGRLIDVGCGTKPHARFLAPLITDHVGVDLPDGPHGREAVDVVGSAYDTHQPTAGADTVLMSQVFEHLEDPAAALAEARRILRPGGAIVLSTNFAWHIHEAPRDFFRFSRFGLEHLFMQAGFDIETIEPVSGAWFTVLVEMAYALRRWGGGSWIRMPVAIVLGHVMQAAALGLDRLAFDDQLATGYVVVARRPKDSGKAPTDR